MSAPSRFDDLLRRWSDGDATLEDLAELEALLRSDALYRRALVRMVRLDVGLYARYAQSAARTSEVKKLPGNFFTRVAAIMAVAVSLAAAAWLLFRTPAEPTAWRVASGEVRVAGEPAARLEPGQSFEVGAVPLRMALDGGTIELGPSTVGRRQAVGVLRLERGGGAFSLSSPLRVETPAAVVGARGGRFEIRIDEVPASTEVRLAEGDVEARYAGQTLRLRTGQSLRLGGARTLDRTTKADELLRAAAFDLATAVDRVAAEVQGVPVEAVLEEEKGRAAFGVEVAVGPALRERTLDAATGAVLEDESENDDRSALAARVRTPLAAAIRTSVEAVSGRAVQAVSDLRDGAPRARVEIVAAEGVFEVVVDLERGHVVSVTQ